MNESDAETPASWSLLSFDTWRVSTYTKWVLQQQQLAAAAIALPTTAGTMTATQLAADRFPLQDYRKISKSAKDYNLLKHEEYFCGWMEKFEEQAALHKMDSLINSKFDNTEDHRQTLKAGSNELVLFEEQALFLSAVFRHILKTVKGK